MMEKQKLLSFKALVLGFVFIGVILLVSCLHYRAVKLMMKSRKII